MSAKATRRYNTDPPRRVLTRAGLTIGLLLLAGYLAVKSFSGVPLKHYDRVVATVPDAGSLILHDPVRTGGKRVGQVLEIGSAPDGEARLGLQLEGDADLPKDSRILIRANGLLGARYVELVPGTSRERLASGDEIHGDKSSLTFGVIDALDVFDARTRGRLRPLIGELGTGLLGQGRNVNDLLRVGGQQIIPTSELFAELNRPAANEALLPSMEAMMRPLDDNRVAIGKLFGTSADAFAPFADERDATRAMLNEAPGALASATSGLTEGRTLLAGLRSLAANVRTALPPAPAALDETRALLIEARGPLTSTRELLKSAGPAVPSALRITSSLKPVLKPATQLLSTLKPMVDTIGPYRCDIENFGAVFRSMTGLGSRGVGGPGGPAMEFRLQLTSPTGFENFSHTDSTGLVKREGYVEPCKYLSKPYLILEHPVRARSR